MTTREKLIQTLEKNGMGNKDAIAAASSAIKEMQKDITLTDVNWGSGADGYMDLIHESLFKAAKPHILEWIDKTKPESWYRGMFV